MVINGLTTFVVDRGRQEAMEYSLEMINDSICNNKDAKIFFGHLCVLAGAADSSGRPLLPGRLLYAAIVADIHDLPVALAKWFDEHRGDPAAPAIACGLNVAYQLADALARQQDARRLPEVALKTLLEYDPCKELLKKWAGSPVETAAVALGRAIATLNESQLDSPAAVSAAAKALVPEADIANLEKLANTYLALDRAVRRFDKAGTRETRLAAGRDMLAQVIATTQALLDLLQQTDSTQTIPPEDLAKVYISLRAATALLEGDLAGAIGDLLTLIPVERVKQEPFKSILRVAPVIADIAIAKSSDEVAAALENAAEPLGSWRMRRKSPVWGLSARLGGGGALEWARPAAGEDYRRAWSVGVYAPVGLDASLPLHFNSLVLGGMLQVIDLGSLASARLEQDSTGPSSIKTEPKVGVIEVFAPGVNVFLGLGNSPFVLSVGASWVPALRQPVSGGDAVSAYRITTNLSVDIPIFMW
jgi:hypothetical protein